MKTIIISIFVLLGLVSCKQIRMWDEDKQWAYYVAELEKIDNAPVCEHPNGLWYERLAQLPDYSWVSVYKCKDCDGYKLFLPDVEDNHVTVDGVAIP